MVQSLTVQIIVFIAVADIATSLIDDLKNKTLKDVSNHVTKLETRRKSKTRKDRSTSSSSGEKGKSSSEKTVESLDLSSSEDLSSDSAEVKKNRYKPKSSLERTGWRKWHRKCPQCPEDMVKKWRDPSISWICGAYQRARRTFKSECMMHYRNCQDGTMFVEIYKGRCNNDGKDDPQPHGDHFFYEYKVALTDDSSAETDDTSSAHASTTEDSD